MGMGGSGNSTCTSNSEGDVTKYAYIGVARSPNIIVFGQRDWPIVSFDKYNYSV